MLVLAYITFIPLNRWPVSDYNYDYNLVHDDIFIMARLHCHVLKVLMVGLLQFSALQD